MAMPSPETPKLDPEVEKKALDLVESLSEQVLNLHASANRIRAQTQVGDLLWARDEKRARTLFTTAILLPDRADHAAGRKVRARARR